MVAGGQERPHAPPRAAARRPARRAARAASSPGRSRRASRRLRSARADELEPRERPEGRRGRPADERHPVRPEPPLLERDVPVAASSIRSTSCAAQRSPRARARSPLRHGEPGLDRLGIVVRVDRAAAVRRSTWACRRRRKSSRSQYSSPRSSAAEAPGTTGSHAREPRARSRCGSCRPSRARRLRRTATSRRPRCAPRVLDERAA